MHLQCYTGITIDNVRTVKNAENKEYWADSIYAGIIIIIIFNIHRYGRTENTEDIMENWDYWYDCDFPPRARD